MKKIVAGILLAYLGVVAFFYLEQRALVFPAPAVVSLAGEGVQVIATTAEDGQQVHGWFRPPPDTQSPVVIFFHGNKAALRNRDAWAETWNQAGYGVFQAGYRGYDGEGGHPSEAGLYADARAQTRWLLQAGYGKIVFWGESLGTGIAIRMATEFPAQAVVLEAPYADLVEVAAWHYPFLPVRWLMRDRFDSVGRAARIAAPVLIVHGTHDHVVPMASAQRLFAALPEPKEAHWIAGADHGNLYAHGAESLIRRFLARTAPPAEP